MTAALVFGELERSGAAIDARAALLAGGLARLGIEDGDVVAVMLRNDPAFVDIIQGCRIAGAYYCQINWHFKRDEAGFILNDCGAKVLFIQPDLLAEIAAAIPKGVSVIVADEFESWLAAQAPYAGAPRTPRGHMAYTSGTTGRPKGVRRRPPTPKQQVLAAQVMNDALGIYPGVRTALRVPSRSVPCCWARCWCSKRSSTPRPRWR